MTDQLAGIRLHCLHLLTWMALATVHVVILPQAVDAADGSRQPDVPQELWDKGVTVVAQTVTFPATAPITDIDITNAETLGTIETLECHSHTLSPQGIIDLLSKTKGLKYVTLSGPGVNDEVVAALGEHHGLKWIFLKGPIHGDGFLQLEKLRPRLEFLFVQCEPIKRQGPFIGEYFGLTDEGIEQIGKFDRLGYLSLRECGIMDKHLKHFDKLTSLSGLQLDGNPITGSGLAVFDERLPRLTALALSSCRLTDEGLRDFPHLESLHYLSLANNQIGDKSIAAIVQSDPDELTRLILSGTDVTNQSLAILNELKHLETLVLAYTRITNIEALHALPIEVVDVSGTQFSDEEVKQFSGLTTLKVLNLYGTAITDRSLSVLEGLPDLTHLGVGNTKLSATSIQKLVESLPNCRVEPQDEMTFLVIPPVHPKPRIKK
ncbi:leucine-rich repeat domain-containing protein [Bremerella cremea]|nr:hypothetical protein [Bremerella cremea]